MHTLSAWAATVRGRSARQLRRCDTSVAKFTINTLFILYYSTARSRVRARPTRAIMASRRCGSRLYGAQVICAALIALVCATSATASSFGPCKHRASNGACAPLLRGAGDRAAASTTSGVTTVLFLPLDERFTTRDAFLHLALTTTFQVISPPAWMLPHHKVPANLTALDAWMQANMPRADAAIISAE